MCVERDRETEIYYYKELAHTGVEAGKSQDLQGESASWRPTELMGLVGRLRSVNSESQWCKFHSKGWYPQDGGRVMFQCKSEGRKRLVSQFKGRQAEFSLT